jgi:hypothetical protein
MFLQLTPIRGVGKIRHDVGGISPGQVERGDGLTNTERTHAAAAILVSACYRFHSRSIRPQVPADSITLDRDGSGHEPFHRHASRNPYLPLATLRAIGRQRALPVSTDLR